MSTSLRKGWGKLGTHQHWIQTSQGPRKNLFTRRLARHVYKTHIVTAGGGFVECVSGKFQLAKLDSTVTRTVRERACVTELFALGGY